LACCHEMRIDSCCKCVNMHASAAGAVLIALPRLPFFKIRTTALPSVFYSRRKMCPSHIFPDIGPTPCPKISDTPCFKHA